MIAIRKFTIIFAARIFNSKIMEYNRNYLSSIGFEGFLRVADLEGKENLVPSEGGIYYVIRYNTDTPKFLDKNIGGHFKGREPSVNKEELKNKWVENCQLVYIGKAKDLNVRLKALMDFASGKPVGHWGGRYLWQLADSDDLIICWKQTNNEPKKVESMLLKEFENEYAQLPFANIAGPSKDVDKYYKRLHDDFYRI